MPPYAMLRCRQRYAARHTALLLRYAICYAAFAAAATLRMLPLIFTLATPDDTRYATAIIIAAVSLL